MSDVVSTPFVMGQEPYVFRSHLILTQAEFDAASPQDIEDMKTARYQSWLAVLSGGQDNG